MRLSEARERLTPFIGKRFSDIFPSDLLIDLRTNKGNVGQLVEKLIGIPNNSRTIDFEDGELKTNKCDVNGNPLETIFITQIASCIDDVLNKSDFTNTNLYRKIKNILYVPVAKVGSEANWMILSAINIDLTLPEYSNLYKQFENDYYVIAEQLLKHIETSPDGFIHTSNGKFIQVRSKDSKPYHPIYSQKFGRNVSNKNHAFYFRKDFIRHIRTLNK